MKVHLRTVHLYSSVIDCVLATEGTLLF